MKLVIIDDEPPAIEILEDYISTLEEIELLASFKDPLEALKSEAVKEADLLLLDISMPRLSGMDLLNVLPEQPKVIFTTAHHQHALESYNYLTIDYLVKPIPYERFLKAIRKAERLLKKPKKQAKNKLLIVKNGRKNVKIDSEQIHFVKAYGDFVHIYYEDKRLMASATLKWIAEELKEVDFIRVHRSYLINGAKIQALSAQQIQVGKWEIPVGRMYRELVQRYYLND